MVTLKTVAVLYYQTQQGKENHVVLVVERKELKNTLVQLLTYYSNKEELRGSHPFNLELWTPTGAKFLIPEAYKLFWLSSLNALLAY